MDTRKLFEETTTTRYTFPKDKYIKSDTKFTNKIITESLSIYWQNLLNKKFRVQLNYNNSFSLFISISYAINTINNNSKNNENKISIKLIKQNICEYIEKLSVNKNSLVIIKNIINDKNNNKNKNLLELYKNELIKEKDKDYKLITTENMLITEIMNDNYDGCIIDIILLSIIYSLNFIILDKRQTKESKKNYNIIGPQFGAFNNNVLLYRGISTEKNTFIYNIIQYRNKYIFKKNEFPQKFIDYIYK
jgi:hypothetical protein